MLAALGQRALRYMDALLLLLESSQLLMSGCRCRCWAERSVGGCPFHAASLFSPLGRSHQLPLLVAAGGVGPRAAMCVISANPSRWVTGLISQVFCWSMLVRGRSRLGVALLLRQPGGPVSKRTRRLTREVMHIQQTKKKFLKCRCLSSGWHT